MVAIHSQPPTQQKSAYATLRSADPRTLLVHSPVADGCITLTVNADQDSCRIPGFASIAGHTRLRAGCSAWSTSGAGNN